MPLMVEKIVAGASSSDPIITNQYEVPFNVGFGVTVVAAVASAPPTYSVQHTFDNVKAGASATWFDHSEVSGQTAAIDGNYAYPVAAIRLTLTAAGSGASSATLKVLQTGV